MNNLKHKIISGAIFQSLGGSAQVLIRLLGSMLLARLLTPEDFGIFVIATLIFGLLSQLKIFGATQSVISKKNVTQNQLSTIFFMNIFIGFFIFIIMYFLSYPIAIFYEKENITLVLQVISTIFIIQSINVIPTVLLNKKMDFKIINIIHIIGAMVEIGLACILVIYYHFDYWALVIGLVSAEIIMTIIKIYVVKWKPNIVFHKKVFIFYIIHGFNLSGENIFMYFRQNFDGFLISRMFDTHILGIYSFANRLPSIVLTKLLSPISGVILPAMSTMKTEKEVLNLFYKFTKFNGLIAIPLLVSIYVLSEPIILLLWGNQWTEASPYMQLLTIVVFTNILGLPTGSVFLRYGKTNLLFKLAIIKSTISIVLILISAYLFGILGVLYGKIIATLISYFISIYYLNIFKEFNIKLIYSIILQFIIIIILLTFISISIYDFMTLNQFNNIIKILSIIFSIILTQIFILIVFFKNDYNQIKELLKRKIT